MLNLSHRYKRNIFFSVYCFLFFYIQLSVAGHTGVQSLFLCTIEDFYFSAWFGNFSPAIGYTAIVEYFLLISSFHVHSGGSFRGEQVVGALLLLPIWMLLAPVTFVVGLLYFIAQYLYHRGKTIIPSEMWEKFAVNAMVERPFKQKFHFLHAVILLLNLSFGVVWIIFTAVYPSVAWVIVCTVVLLFLRVLMARIRNKMILCHWQKVLYGKYPERFMALLCYLIRWDGRQISNQTYFIEFCRALLECYESPEAAILASAFLRGPVSPYHFWAMQVQLDSCIFTSETSKVIDLEYRFQKLCAERFGSKACPKDLETYFQAVFAYFHRDYDRARTLFVRLGEQVTLPEGVPNIKKLYFLALMDVEEGKKEEAKAALEEILSVDFDRRLVRMAKRLYASL